MALFQEPRPLPEAKKQSVLAAFAIDDSDEEEEGDMTCQSPLSVDSFHLIDRPKNLCSLKISFYRALELVGSLPI